MTEVWRTIQIHPRYAVSSWGRVKNQVKGNILKATIGSHGYPMVSLGRKIKRTVHSLVAEEFLGPCPIGQEVRHKDDERWNPALNNLEYGTRAQNVKDAFERGSRTPETQRINYLKGRKAMGSEARQAASLKTVETRNKIYGPGHTRLGFAGVKYSGFDL